MEEERLDEYDRKLYNRLKNDPELARKVMDLLLAYDAIVGAKQEEGGK